MHIGYITGSGFYDLPGFSEARVKNRFGEARLLHGSVGAGHAVTLLPRHRTGHALLPHQINHRANLLALKEAGVDVVVSFSVCGVINPNWPLAAPFLASDLYYPDNRLGDGSTCTLFTEPGETGRGHLLPESFFNTTLLARIRSILISSGNEPLDGCYAHVPGPRFDSRVEIAALRATGVDFLSQTCGPETILANELELPYALVGFGVDYANGVSDERTPVETLKTNLQRGKDCFEFIVKQLSGADEPAPEFENFVYRFE
ncbi:MAG: phosphorylase [Verrucomicrobia bacterium]|jgi:purine nucleoside phosphorylase|nr:phosphorylase [Verrucomicrobiota bacterium]